MQFYKSETPSESAVNNQQQLHGPSGQHQKVSPLPGLYSLPTRRAPDSTSGDPRLVEGNESASLLDLGDGAACLVFHTKMNAIDSDITQMMQRAVARVSSDFATLVIGNEGAAFSAGANIKVILEAINDQRFDDIDRLLREFQGALQLIKFAPFPTVAVPHGLTLGGGLEVALHTTWRVAAAETYAGLVEAGVGLVPAGGGTKELALDAYAKASCGEKADPMPFLQKAFLLIVLVRFPLRVRRLKKKAYSLQQLRFTSQSATHYVQQKVSD